MCWTLYKIHCAQIFLKDKNQVFSYFANPEAHIIEDCGISETSLLLNRNEIAEFRFSWSHINYMYAWGGFIVFLHFPLP